MQVCGGHLVLKPERATDGRHHGQSLRRASASKVPAWAIQVDRHAKELED